MTTINPTCDADGFDTIVAAVEWLNPGKLAKFPKVDVTVTVEADGRTYRGTLLRFKKATSNDGEGTLVGWFAVLDNADGAGHVNVYADPNSGGPRVIKVYDYEGEGAERYKYPIESVSMEIDAESPPTCPECGEEMVLGHSRERDNRAMAGDGSRGRWVGGILCPECFPGSVTEDGEKGLP